MATEDCLAEEEPRTKICSGRFAVHGFCPRPRGRLADCPATRRKRGRPCGGFMFGCLQSVRECLTKAVSGYCTYYSTSRYLLFFLGQFKRYFILYESIKVKVPLSTSHCGFPETSRGPPSAMLSRVPRAAGSRRGRSCVPRVTRHRDRGDEAHLDITLKKRAAGLPPGLPRVPRGSALWAAGSPPVFDPGRPGTSWRAARGVRHQTSRSGCRATCRSPTSTLNSIFLRFLYDHVRILHSLTNSIGIAIDFQSSAK